MTKIGEIPAKDLEGGRTFFIRCGGCQELYRAEVDLLSGEPLWFAPKKKRGGCQHTHTEAEVWTGTEWQAVAT